MEMKAAPLLLMLVLGLGTGIQGGVIHTWLQRSMCGSWTPYGPQKCLTILPDPYNKEMAEIMCSLASENSTHLSQIVQVNSVLEQEILQDYLFQKQLHGSVWLEVKRDGDNPEEEDPMEDSDNECVEMASGLGNLPAGEWVTVPCTKTNIVVCERLQTHPSDSLRGFWTSMKMNVANLAVAEAVQNTTVNQITETALEWQNETIHSSSLEEPTEPTDAAESTEATEEIESTEATVPTESTAGMSNVWPSKPQQSTMILHRTLPIEEVENESEVLVSESEKDILHTLIQRLEAVEEQLHEVKLMNKKATEEITALKEENSDAKQEIYLLKQQNVDRLGENTVNKIFCDVINSCESMQQVAETQIKIEELFTLNRDSSKELSLLKHKTEATEMEISALKSKSHDIEHDVTATKGKYELIQKETSATKTTNEQTLKEIIALKQNSESSRREDDAIKANLNEIRISLNNQKEYNEATDERINVMNQCSQVVEDLIHSLETQFKSTKTEVSRFKFSVANYAANLENLKENPVPVGFTYTQLPRQLSPNVIWPTLTWKEVSSTYAGLFFRTVGGGASAFGEVQSDQTRHIDYITSVRHHDTTRVYLGRYSGTSASLYSGGDMGLTYALRFSLSSGEVRPSNTAVRIWVRTK